MPMAPALWPEGRCRRRRWAIPASELPVCVTESISMWPHSDAHNRLCAVSHTTTPPVHVHDHNRPPSVDCFCIRPYPGGSANDLGCVLKAISWFSLLGVFPRSEGHVFPDSTLSTTARRTGRQPRFLTSTYCLRSTLVRCLWMVRTYLTAGSKPNHSLTHDLWVTAGRICPQDGVSAMLLSILVSRLLGQAHAESSLDWGWSCSQRNRGASYLACIDRRGPYR